MPTSSIQWLYKKYLLITYELWLRVISLTVKSVQSWWEGFADTSNEKVTLDSFGQEAGEMNTTIFKNR